MSESEDRVRVLVVEDERIVAADLQRMLRQLGYDAYASAPTAAKSLRLAEETPPHVVLADIRIEGPVDGIDVAFQLHQKYGAEVIFLTAHADDPTLERAKHAEPSGYLIKPITAPALKAALELALDRRTRQATAQAFEHALSGVTADLLCALDHLPLAIQLEDAQGRIAHLNAAFRSLFGVVEERTKLIGRSGTALLDHVQSQCLDPELFARITETLRRSGQPVSGDLVCLSDGRKLELEYVPLVQGGRLQGRLWSFRDISVSERARRELDRPTRGR